MRSSLVVSMITILVTTATLAADDPLYGGGTATPNGTPEAAFTQGKTFAGEMQSTVQGSFTEEKAKAAMEYDANPVEASYYDITPPRDKGTEKQNYCASVDLATLTEQKRKECEAVNYLTDTQGRSNPYVIDESTDPLFQRYQEGIELSKKISADTCSIEGSNVPGAGGYTEVCSEGIQREDSTCQENLSVTVESKRYTYTLEFAVTAIMSKTTSNGCEEDASSLTVDFDLGKFTSYFKPSELSSGQLWQPTRYSGIFAGSWIYQDVPRHQRVTESMTSLYAHLIDNKNRCHITPNMYAGFYIRPIYSNDMLNFLFKDGDANKVTAANSFKNVVNFRILEVRVPTGMSPYPGSDQTCGIGQDVPKTYYNVGGPSLANGPNWCFQTAPSQNFKVTDVAKGLVSLEFGRFGTQGPAGGRSFNYSHNYSSTAIGMAYPRIIKLYIEKDAPKYTDNWDDQCKSLKGEK